MAVSASSIERPEEVNKLPLTTSSTFLRTSDEADIGFRGIIVDVMGAVLPGVARVIITSLVVESIIVVFSVLKIDGATDVALAVGRVFFHVVRTNGCYVLNALGGDVPVVGALPIPSDLETKVFLCVTRSRDDWSDTRRLSTPCDRVLSSLGADAFFHLNVVRKVRHVAL